MTRLIAIGLALAAGVHYVAIGRHLDGSVLVAASYGFVAVLELVAAYLLVRPHVAAGWRVVAVPVVAGLAFGFALPAQPTAPASAAEHGHTDHAEQRSSGTSVDDLFRSADHADHACDLFHPCDE